VEAVCDVRTGKSEEDQMVPRVRIFMDLCWVVLCCVGLGCHRLGWVVLRCRREGGGAGELRLLVVVGSAGG
jgi:hypothetical protein